MRNFLPLVALFLCAGADPAIPASPALVRSDPRLHQVIERYLAWRGGPAFLRLRSTYTVADVEMEGLKGVTREWRTREGAARDELDLGPIHQLSTSDGRTAWAKDGGLVSQQSRYAVTDLKREAQVEFGTALSGDGASRELLPSELIDGKRWAVLRIRFGDSDKYDLFIDPATGALHGRRYTTDARPFIVRYSDWRLVQGVRMPFVRRVYRPSGSLYATIKVRSVALNRSFAHAPFSRPRQQRTIRFANGATTTGPIRYNNLQGVRIYIPAKVNGRDVEVLLDSGADQTTLDKGFAQSLGRSAIGRSKAVGTGGEADSAYARDISIDMGNLSLRLPTVGIIDLAEVSKRIGIPLPVVLGKEIFLQAIVDIDPSGPTIAFHDPAKFSPPAGAVMVPLEPLGTLRVVPVSVEGLPDAPMVFDLGNGGAMFVNAPYWQSHHLLAGRRSSTVSSGAVGGEQINRVATLKDVRFAGVTLRNVPAEFVSPNVAIDTDREAGNIGMPILGRFRMMIDFPNNRMFVVPLAGKVDAPFDRGRVGLRTVQEGNKLVVRYVSEGSPAAAAGFKPGDEIVAIDGQTIGADYPNSPLAKWGRGPVGTVVTLTLSDRSTRKVILADYY